MDPETENQQEELVEGVNEEGDLEDIEVPEMGRPSIADVAAVRAAAIGEKVGGAARGLLAGVGARIESPSPPTDDLSDLFEGPDMERDNDVYIKDLVSVEEEDVFGDGGADMSDILEVTDEDVMGDEDIYGDDGRSARQPAQTTRRFSQRAIPPTGISGLQA